MNLDRKPSINHKTEIFSGKENQQKINVTTGQSIVTLWTLFIFKDI